MVREVTDHPTPATIGAEIQGRAGSTSGTVAAQLRTPLASPLMHARMTSDNQMQRRRFLTTPQSAGERPQIIVGQDYKMRRSVEYASQGVHHEATNNYKAVPYKEQLSDAYNADRRRVPVDPKTDGTGLRDYWKDMISSIREPTDEKIFQIELELRSAQAQGDTYRMNICRDQIAQLEKQYLYDKKLAMKLLMDEKLGASTRKLRMEKDWTGTLDGFKVEVEEERMKMKDRHSEEQSQFKSEIMGYAQQYAGLQVSDQVKQMRAQVAALVKENKFDEARDLKTMCDQMAMEELRGQSPLVMMRNMRLDQRMAALNIKQNMEEADFEHKVESKAVGLAVWRVGMDFVE